MDKCLAEIKLHLPEELKRDLQDWADQHDRKTSEAIRVILEDFMYGSKRRLCAGETRVAERGEASR
jgi:hypothetical protein